MGFIKHRQIDLKGALRHKDEYYFACFPIAARMKVLEMREAVAIVYESCLSLAESLCQKFKSSTQQQRYCSSLHTPANSRSMSIVCTNHCSSLKLILEQLVKEFIFSEGNSQI